MSEESTRIESGPVQFGDDWPGLFLRGDMTFAHKVQLASVIALLEEKQGRLLGEFQLAALKNLLSDLDSCEQGAEVEPQKLRPYEDCLPEGKPVVGAYHLEQLLPRIQYPGWFREREHEGRMLRMLSRNVEMAFFTSTDDLRVMLTLEEGGWLHMSVSRPDVLPTWDELKMVKQLWLGDRFAVQIFPPKEHWLNFHEYTLHLFCRVDGEPILPEPLWANPYDEPEEGR